MVPTGNAAAHSIGLTTQVPVRSVYLTPGCRRKMSLGGQALTSVTRHGGCFPGMWLA
nr:DUF6088 family protein [Paracoccus solventivorans]